ncbi:MAG: hypothetical protein ABI650_11435, partial [Dokdonella sp.]
NGAKPTSHADLDAVMNAAVTPAALARTLEREVIPRLMVAHRRQRSSSAAGSAHGRTESAEVVAFTDLIMAPEMSGAFESVARRRAGNVSLESIYLDLLMPAARRLSDLWEADLCHYEEIAIGMLHLQQVLRELSPEFSDESECRPHGPKALLLSAPGEQSMLGVYMVTEFHRCLTAEFFHRAGWEVWRAPPRSRAQLLDVVGSNWFDVIDISATCEGRLPQLVTDLADLRKVSRNSRVGMMIGGQVFDEHPELADCLGADACACDPRAALAHAEMLVTLRER